MKTGRRMDPESLRRDPRDRDFPMGRARKRPSMLSEFHGKHYKMNRENPNGPYFRSHNRYGYEPLPGGTCMKHERYGPGFYKSEMIDPRRNPYAHNYMYSRSSHYHHQANTHFYNEDFSQDEEVPVKRPRLYVDVSRRTSTSFDTPNSADSVASSNFSNATLNAMPHMDSPALGSPQGTGLSAYLEDIDSDDDTLLQDEEDEKSPEKAPEKLSSPGRPSKEELLQMMERVDRDIAATEGQITALQKKQAELEENAKTSSTVSSIPPTPSPFQPSPDLPVSEETSPLPSPSEESRRPSPKRSLVETIYTENRLKARTAQMAFHSFSFPTVSAHTVTPLYHQPCEAPQYQEIIEKHKRFRPKLVEYVRKRKLAKHRHEVTLCEQYDSLMAEWERRIEKLENSSKKRARDFKSREIFEKVFPELKTRREQQERFTRVDQRGFGVVRSDAELKELMFELYEQAEAPARYRRTHATIPPMVMEQDLRFYSTNGLIADPMAMYREFKFTNVWTDEEKKIFREKYILYPKNFEMIASFLSNKSTSECVKYYYLSKKNENFKQLVRKANLKKRKLVKPQEFVLTSPTHMVTPPPPALPPSMLVDEKPKLELLPLNGGTESPPSPRHMEPKPAPPTKLPGYGDWTEGEIMSLKEGLRKYGRAWGKIYREVGGRKTATQCKQFFDDFCRDEELDLHQALMEHSSLKNAEKARRKAESRKSVPAMSAEPKKKGHKLKREDMDSENTESASDSESASGEELGSESTITDSSPEEVPSQPPQRTQRGRKNAHSSSSGSAFVSKRTSEEAVDLFISAAEALNKIVPPEIALHDHTYALPPSSLLNSVDLQGTSGLSLIAAAAAVVSPSLSRSAGSGKVNVLSPVRAPRGRPPNSQKRGSGNSTSKLAPTLLSPAGSSNYVPLTDIKTPTFRGRTRSAPTDRPKPTIQIPRMTSALSRVCATSGSKPRGVMPPASYSRHRESSGSPSLKSMIASHPQQANSSTAAFEALVNVAVAAPPAELPKTPANTSTTASTPLPSSMTHQGRLAVSGSSSTPATPLSAPVQVQQKDGNTTIWDVNQAINILVSLAQQAPSSQPVSVLTAQSLFAQTPVFQASNFLSNFNLAGLVQSSGEQNSTSAAPTATTTSPSSGISHSVDTLVGHLIAGTHNHSAVTSPLSQSASSGQKKSAGGISSVTPSTSKGNQQSQPTTVTQPSSSSSQPPALEGSVLASQSDAPQTTSSTANEELSNLNLLSSLVAAVAASQTPTPETTPTSASTDELPTATPQAIQTPIAVARTSAESTEAQSTTSSSLLTQPYIPSAAVSLENLSPDQGRGEESHSAKSQFRTPEENPSGTTLSGWLTPPPTQLAQELPRSVVRPSMSTRSREHSPVELHRSAIRTSPEGPSSTSSSADITASLASIIPSSLSYPTISQQSTLLLYTRSLSFPLPSTAETSPEEEDHLESATRGISELSKLLGTDSGSEMLGAVNETTGSPYKGVVSWNPNDLLSSSSSLSFTGAASGRTLHTNKSIRSTEATKPFLSSLLESHRTAHTPSPASDSGQLHQNSSNIDVEHSR